MKKRNAQATKEAILTAAKDEFVQKGFHGARIDEISAASGVNKRMIYHYFGSKEGLYDAVLLSVMANLEQNMPRLNGNDPIRGIRKAVTAYFEYCLSHPDYVALMLWEAVTGWEALNRCMRKSEDSWTLNVMDVIEAGKRQGLIRPDLDSMLAVVSITAQIFMLFPLSSRFADLWPASAHLDQVREELATNIIHMITAKPEIPYYPMP